MKITEVRTRVVQWKGKTTPLPPHFCTNPMDLIAPSLSPETMGTFTFHGWLICEVVTDNGLVGIGNAALTPLVTKQVIDRYLAPLVIGADPWDIEFLWQHMYRKTMAFGVGGSAAALERARPVLAAMGRSVVHVGPTGSGALVKLINNFLCGVQAASLAEALVLIERAGLDSDTVTQVLANGAPGSPLVKTLLPRMTARDYAPNFHLSLMSKDLAYSLKEAERQGVHLATARAALDAFERGVTAGRGQDDFSAVIEPLREKATYWRR